MKRTFIPSEARDAVPIDLLDGGTLGIYPMTFDRADAYTDLVTRTDYARDEKGNILYNQKTGEPVRRFAGTTQDEVDFAVGLVAYVKNLEKHDGTPLELNGASESDRQTIVAFLKELNTSEITLDSKGQEFIGAPGQVRADGSEKQPKTLRVTEPLFRLVLREAARLRREINELQRKNS